jgi:outer membrane protein TolC
MVASVESGISSVARSQAAVMASFGNRGVRSRPVMLAVLCVAGLTLAGCEDIYRQEVAHQRVEDFSIPVQAVTTRVVSGPEMGLDDFVEVVLHHNPELADARRQVEAAEAHISERRAALLPQVRLEAEATTTEQRVRSTTNPSFSPDQDQSSRENYEATLTISQALLDGPALADLRTAQAQLDGRRAELADAEQTTIDTALQLYLSVVEAYERYRLAQAEIRFFSHLAEEEDARVSAGEMRAARAVGTRAELARARTAAISASQDFMSRRNELCRIAQAQACPRVGAMSIGGALPRPVPLSDTERMRIADSPAQRALLASLEVANREIDRAVSERLPRVTARIDFERRRQVGNTVFAASSDIGEIRAGVYLDWVLFSSGRVTAARDRRVAEAQSSVERIRSERNVQLNQLESADASLLSLWRNDAALRELVSLRREAVSQARRERDAGQLTDLAVRELEMEVARNEVGLSAVRRNYLLALVARHRATGSLDEGVIALIHRLTSAPRASDRQIAAVSRR